MYKPIRDQYSLYISIYILHSSTAALCIAMILRQPSKNIQTHFTYFFITKRELRYYDV